MIAIRIRAARERGRELFPGLLASGVVAAAAAFLSQHYGAPAMLFALLLGMAMNFLGSEGRCTAGIAFSARSVLRIWASDCGGLLRTPSRRIQVAGRRSAPRDLRRRGPGWA